MSADEQPPASGPVHSGGGLGRKPHTLQWLRLDPGSFLDHVDAMSAEELGAYVRLFCKAWSQEPPASVPDDDAILCRWARIAPARWQKIRDSVLAPFQRRRGRFFEPKLLAGRRFAEGLYQARKKGAETTKAKYPGMNNMERSARAQRADTAVHNNTLHTNSTYTPDLTDVCSELWGSWPEHRRGGRIRVEQKLAEVVGAAADPQACVAAIRRNAVSYLQSEEVRRGICFGLGRWLSDGHWVTEPAIVGPRRPISADELELLYAARRCGGDDE